MEPEVRIAPVRFFEIDLLRFLAAISVVFYHYTYAAYNLGGGDVNRLSPLAFEGLGYFTQYGALGVECFFMVSGYVVLLSAQGKTVRQFFISRVIRLYPTFWVACTLTFLALRIWASSTTVPGGMALTKLGLGTYIFSMTMLQEFFGVAGVDGVYWTLTIEVAFYFLISLLIGYNLLGYIKWFMAGWLLLCLLPLLPGADFRYTTFYKLVFPEYAPFFIAGMVFYLLQQPAERTWRNYILLGISYLLSLRTMIVAEINTIKAFKVQTDWRPAALLVTAFFLVFYFIAFRKINLSRYTWLAKVGALTYPLYLLHASIGYLVFWKLGPYIDKNILLVLTIFAMLVAAHLMHIIIEKPLTKPLGQWLKNKLANIDRF